MSRAQVPAQHRAVLWFLEDISRQKTSDQLSMRFEFLALPPEFELPFRDGAEVRAACEAEPPAESARRVCDAFDNLSPVWPAKKEKPA